MNNFRIVTINGRMQTADAAPEIDLTAQRIALRKMLHGEVAFHDDPHSGQDLADAIPAAIEHAAACVGPDGVAKFFEGYIPEQAKAAKPVRFDGVDDTLEEFRARQQAAQPVALEGVEHVRSRGLSCNVYKLLGGKVFKRIKESAKWEVSCLSREDFEFLVSNGDLTPINVAAQASNETTAAQEQSKVSATPDSELAPGVYLTRAGGADLFARWDGKEWKCHCFVAARAAAQWQRSGVQARTVIRPATAQELGQ